MTQYPEDVKATIEELLFTLASTMLDNETPFKLVITDEDKWNKPLPVQDQPTNGFLIVEVMAQTLDLSYYNSEEDVIVLTTGFGADAYTRVLDVYDIAGIIDLETGSPIMLKPFKSIRDDEDTRRTVEGIMGSFSSADLLEKQEELYHSLVVLKSFNPELFKD